MHRSRRPRRWLKDSLVVVFTLMTLIMINVSLGTVIKAAQVTTCHHISGPFHRSGNRILNKQGHRYIPYGIVITGLGNPNWEADWPSDDTKIKTAATWCINSYRIQAWQDGLIDPNTYAVNTIFLNALENEVDAGLSEGAVVDINDQGEGALAGSQTHEIMPNKQSRIFWRTIAKIYGNNPDVVFDLLNEPRHILHRSRAQEWNRWRNGGYWAGERWMGMEQLARYVRSLHVNNLFFVEGPETAGSLQYVLAHQITKAGPVEYAVNHGGPINAPHTAAYWNMKFGNASRVVPVTDTEWTNYASSTRMCWANAPKTVPRWLRYLANHGMGMMAWNMGDGVLVTDNGMTTPTRIKHNWACKDGLNEGAGNQIRNWFYRHNS